MTPERLAQIRLLLHDFEHRCLPDEMSRAVADLLAEVERLQGQVHKLVEASKVNRKVLTEQRELNRPLEAEVERLLHDFEHRCLPDEMSRRGPPRRFSTALPADAVDRRDGRWVVTNRWQDLVATIEQIHARRTFYGGATTAREICTECRQAWPCATWKAVDEVVRREVARECPICHGPCAEWPVAHVPSASQDTGG